MSGSCGCEIDVGMANRYLGVSALSIERLDRFLKQFYINFEEVEIEKLRQRIRNARFSMETGNDNWNLGTDSDYLQSLLNYWCYEYDWQRKEQELNLHLRV